MQGQLPPPGKASLRDAAAETGVSVATLHRWVMNGKIPAVRTAYGRRVYVSVDDVRAVLRPAPINPVAS